MRDKSKNWCPICKQPLRAGSCSNCSYLDDTENFRNKLASRVESSIERLGEAIKSRGDRLENNRTPSHLSLDSKETFMTRETMNQKNFIRVQGIARNVAWRERHDYSYQILSFTVEVTDENGDIQRYVPVYLESYRIQGVLSDGDKVHVSGNIDVNGMLIPKEIKNEKTGASVALDGSSELSDPLFWLKVTIIFGAFLTVLALGAWFVSKTGFLGAIVILVVLSVIYFAYSKHRRNRE